MLDAQINFHDFRETTVCTRCALTAEYFPLRANFQGARFTSPAFTFPLKVECFRQMLSRCAKTRFCLRNLYYLDNLSPHELLFSSDTKRKVLRNLWALPQRAALLHAVIFTIIYFTKFFSFGKRISVSGALFCFIQLFAARTVIFYRHEAQSIAQFVGVAAKRRFASRSDFYDNLFHEILFFWEKNFRKRSARTEKGDYKKSRPKAKPSGGKCSVTVTL